MSPRTKEQNDAIRRQRIFQIRHTAAEVFLEKGMNMEMGDIAKRAGIGRGTVYHYYNNKISLLEDVLLEALEEAKKNTDQALQTTYSPLTRLEQYTRLQLSSWVQQPFIFVLFKNFLQSEPIPIQNYNELLQDFHSSLYNPVIETIEEGIQTGQIISIESGIAGKLFLGTLVGTAVSYIGKNDYSDPIANTNWMDDVITVLFRGLKA
ncbi:TetR/AcrR family transcriptional regulator [Brevibacillus laterosporus]|uniref:TetR/AcrR family transcriptional regulator n=1 Tax=Brevibacillus laterosporus TaxID=1465 RepID=A0A518VAV6_BRELA|nr:TetR/AcrR family transcriptional regulator [Brevibacillus laterosporus]